MKEWKNVVAKVGLLISCVWCVMMGAFLLSIPCWLFGYKHIFHVILPAKIQGLGGMKLDKPINKNGSCVNTLFKSINAEVTYKNGKAYVREIHAESTRELTYILSLLEDKYGKPTRNEDSYFFTDWRSWNFIVVTPDPSDPFFFYHRRLCDSSSPNQNQNHGQKSLDKKRLKYSQ